MRAAPALLLALAACGFTAPEDAVPLDPPAIYRDWWLESQSCVQLPVKLHFERVE